MTIEIKGKEYELHFGIRFIRDLDNTHFIVREGVKFGSGLEILYPQLLEKSIVVLSEIIWTATNTALNRPTPAAVDEYIEKIAEDDKLEELFDEVISNLKNGKVTRLPIEKIEKAIAENEKAAMIPTSE